MCAFRVPHSFGVPALGSLRALGSGAAHSFGVRGHSELWG